MRQLARISTAVAAFAALLLAAPSAADPVVDAKTSIYRYATDVSQKVWSDPEARADFEASHVDDGRLHKLSALVAVNAPMGICTGFIPSAIYREWDAKLLVLAAPPIPDILRGTIANLAMDARRKGASAGFIQGMESGEREGLCKDQIEAIRQVIGEL